MVLSRSGAVRAREALIALRAVAGLAFLDSAFIGKDAKVAPAFLSGHALASRVETTFVHTALAPPIASALQHVVVPHAAVFAWAIALGDAFAGITLLTGVFARAGAVVAILRAVTNLLVAGGMGADTIGYNALLIAIGIAVLATTRSASRRLRGGRSPVW